MYNQEDLPEELERYRRYYLGEMKTVLGAAGCQDCGFTEKGHIFEAFWIAAADYRPRVAICQRVVEEAIRILNDGHQAPDSLEHDTAEVPLDIVEGELGNVGELSDDEELSDSGEMSDEIPDGLNQSASNVLYDLGDGYLSDEHWTELQKGLKMLMLLQ
ncbi:hypothetical protein C8F01DRAFT_1318614 [Mycena amicta]|nr:hypothetical protein C8F01DRAFT_1318614 [Mycena amicta]